MNRESVRSAVSGYGMILLAIVFALAAVAAIVRGAGAPSVPLIVTGLVFIVAAVFVLSGLFIVNPNDARVLVLFGTYKGTVKGNGFCWANPFLVKKRITLRARNLNGEKLKVNDKGGNPIQIAAVVVWQVEDTYRASFDVDNYEHYVVVQSEAAVRHLAGRYPYDTFEDGLRQLGDTRYGLQAGLYTRDLGKVLAAVRQLDMGGVMVNDTPIFRVDHMPYGGNRRSGIGREGVRFAVEEMTSLRMVVLR